MTTVHTAIGTDDELGVMYFASLDGVGYLSVSGSPRTAADAETLRAAIEGDGNFKPILFHRDLIQHRFGGVFDSIEVSP